MIIPHNLNLTPIPIWKYKEKAVFKAKFWWNNWGEEIAYYYGRFDLTEFLEINKDAGKEKSHILCICL